MSQSVQELAAASRPVNQQPAGDQTPSGAAAVIAPDDAQSNINELLGDRAAEFEMLLQLMLGEMLGELAHEINQPLAAAINYARACLRFAQAPGPSPLEDLLDLVSKSASQIERASDMVKRLSVHGRPRPRTHAPVDVNRIVREQVARTVPGPSSPTGDVAVEFDLREGLPLVLADPFQIEHVLGHLIHNALDAMSACPPGQRMLRIQTDVAGHEVHVAVGDSGGGVDPHDAARLFEPFFTTKPEGVGLGLPISRSIVEAHGGRISGQARPGGGAIFTFSLPIALDTPGHAHSHGIHR